MRFKIGQRVRTHFTPHRNYPNEAKYNDRTGTIDTISATNHRAPFRVWFDEHRRGEIAAAWFKESELEELSDE